MNDKEKELVEAIQQADKDKDKSRSIMGKLKKAWVEAESNFIEAKIRKERLVEELRVYRATHVL